MVAEVGRVVGLHEVDVLLVPVGPVDPEPLAAKTFRRTGLILLTLGKVVNNYPNFLYWYVFNLCFTCKIQYAYKCSKKVKTSLSLLNSATLVAKNDLRN